MGRMRRSRRRSQGRTPCGNGARTRAMQLRARECQGLPGTMRSHGVKEGSPPESMLQKQHDPAGTWSLDFWPSEPQENKFRFF